MTKKQGNNYFIMLKNMAECSRRAAVELQRILLDFRVNELGDHMEKLHSIEHEGDDQKHALTEKLVKEFITPIEREDIMELTEQIDDVTDAVEDVLLKIYMFNIQAISDDAKDFADIISKCCGELLRIFDEFENFKKPKTLHESIVELNRLEEQGDALYINAVRSLHMSQADDRSVTVWTEIYGSMEIVCDTCEHVADLVEHIILKNT